MPTQAIDKDREKAIRQWHKVVWLGYGLVLLGAAVPMVSYSLRSSDYRFNHAFSISTLLIFSGVVLWVYGRKRVMMLEINPIQPVSIHGDNNGGLPPPPPPNTSHLPGYSESAAPLNPCPYPPTTYYPANPSFQPVTDVPPAYATIFATPPLQNNQSWIQPPPSTPTAHSSCAYTPSTQRQPEQPQNQLQLPQGHPTLSSSAGLHATPNSVEMGPLNTAATQEGVSTTQQSTPGNVPTQGELEVLAPSNGNVMEEPSAPLQNPRTT
eukprot:comp5540_c0_seq1/m.1466 comp5540_c0_seq1/g.1466  ORF comp5540_c0_seq1/g.1466 comp5540_c0_seq1/m.1466 type:complete len:266 (-) comp5540_c0_seq1:22-819(-)